MKLKFLIVTLGGVLVTLNAFSTPTKTVMQGVLNNFMKLIPFMASEQKFSDVKNEAEIKAHLKGLQDAFKQAHSNSKLNLPGFRPSLLVMSEHLQDTIEAFDSKYKFFAHQRLKTTPQICMSCHVQLKKGHRFSFEKSLSKVSPKNFQTLTDYAEFLVLTRQYNEALKNYQAALNNIKTNAESVQKTKGVNPLLTIGPQERHLNEVSRMIMTILVKVNRNFDQALTFVKDHKNYKLFPEHFKEELKSWEKSLGKLKKSKYFDQEIANEAKAVHFIEKYLSKKMNESNSDGLLDMELLAAAGQLSRYLQKAPTGAATPQILYWIAIAEEQNQRSILFSLSDLYLKECIIRFPKHPYAPKCFKEYEEAVIMGYTGSSGTAIPEEEKLELERLKNLIK